MKLSSEILKVVLVSSLILILSCGKKSTGRPGVPGYYGNYNGFYNNLSPGSATTIQTYFNKFPCTNGRIPEITFAATQAYAGNTTTIQGGLQANPIGGAPSSSYIGINTVTKDIIVITKMTSGAQVAGYNISLSLCRDIRQMNSAYGMLNIPIIDQSRLPAVYGASPIIITDRTTCGMGSVDQATVGLYIPPYRVPNSNVTYPGAQLPISFTTVCL